MAAAEASEATGASEPLALEPISVTFRGCSVSVAQVPLLAHTPQGAIEGAVALDTTGRLVWECCAVFLKWLGCDAHLACLSGAPTAGLTVLDLSCGAGLVPLALCSAPGLVSCLHAWETALQLPLLQRNLAPVLGPRCLVAPYYWGQDPALPFAGPPPALDAVLCSDVLYIALRDGLARQLSCTLRHLAGLLRRPQAAILFGFEERLLQEEEGFMQSLRLPLPPAEGSCSSGAHFWQGAAPALSVEELPSADTLLSREETVGSPDIFWQPPNVRLFLLRRAAV